MNIFIVYAHPDKDSFTARAKDSFIEGLEAAGHTYEISDLYKMGFDPVFTQKEYRREAFYNNELPVPQDVIDEQEKINRADVVVFIYPVFWTECPAILTGWFQRVWTYGFAYGNEPAMKKLDKMLFLVTMGGSTKDAVRIQEIEAMKTVMITDRVNQRAKTAEMIVFDEMTRGYGNDTNREERTTRFCNQAFELGKSI